MGREEVHSCWISAGCVEVIYFTVLVAHLFHICEMFPTRLLEGARGGARRGSSLRVGKSAELAGDPSDRSFGVAMGGCRS